MTLFLAKGRAPLVYTWPLPAVTAGTTFVHEVLIWDAAGAPMVLDGYGFSARIADRFSDRVVATGAVSIPATGKVRCTFAAAALTQEETEVYRFTLDAVGSSGVQRLVDSRLQVQGGGVGIAVDSSGEIVVPDPPDVPDPPVVVVSKRTISLVSPTTVFTNVPTVITLTGTNFAATDKVRVGSSATPITPTTVTATQITFTLPGTFAAGAQSIYVAPAPNYLTTDPATSLPATVTLAAAPASPYPNAGNTGPTGTLIDQVGDINVNQASTVIENIRLTGYINVAQYDNCIIRNCEINSGAFFGIDADGAGNILIEDVRVIGAGGQGGILVNNGTVRRCDVSGFQNGILFAGGPNLIENNYVHDLQAWDAASAHFDGMQTGGCVDTVIQHNTVISFDTSDVFLKNDFGDPITNVKVLDNQFISDPRGSPQHNVYVDGRGTTALVSNVEVAYNFGDSGAGGPVYVSTNTLNINVHDNSLVGSLSLASIDPTTGVSGGSAFTLVVTGTNFSGTSVVWFDAVPQTTTFVSATTVQCTIALAGVTAGDKTVQVRDGSRQSILLSFHVLASGTTTFSFYNGVAPGGFAASDPDELTIGARIDPLVPGDITAIKWYRAHANAASSGKVALWVLGGAKLQEVAFSGHTGVGWKSVPLTFTGPLSTSIAYMVGVWLQLGSDGNSWYQADGHKFQTSGLTIPGVASMPPSDGIVTRGAGQKNNTFIYATGDIAEPTGNFEGGGYYVDVDFEPS